MDFKFSDYMNLEFQNSKYKNNVRYKVLSSWLLWFIQFVCVKYEKSAWNNLAGNECDLNKYEHNNDGIFRISISENAIQFNLIGEILAELREQNRSWCDLQ